MRLQNAFHHLAKHLLNRLLKRKKSKAFAEFVNEQSETSPCKSRTILTAVEHGNGGTLCGPAGCCIIVNSVQ